MIRTVIVSLFLLRALGQKCSYPSSKVGKIHGHCYHIYDNGAGISLSERNCADAYGDLAFVFPRGLDAYFANGRIGMVHYGVTSWGPYAKCNHNPGSTSYTCLPRNQQAGVENAPNNGHWYSFPAAGKNKQWSEGTSGDGGCAPKQIVARCFFNLAAKKGGRCGGGCSSATQCMQCLSGVSVQVAKQAWDDAFWNGGCPPGEDTQEEVPFEDDEEAWKTMGIDPMTVKWGFWHDLPPMNVTVKVNTSASIVV